MQERGRGRFRLLEQDGICAVGESIMSDDIYINKSSPLVTRTTGDAPQLQSSSSLPDSAYRPTPQKYKGPVGETCVVDRVLVTNNDDNCPTFKVPPSLLGFNIQSSTR
jgi:DNA-directed RNA polymerase III subunit RPC2